MSSRDVEELLKKRAEAADKELEGTGLPTSLPRGELAVMMLPIEVMEVLTEIGNKRGLNGSQALQVAIAEFCERNGVDLKRRLT